MRLCVCVYVQYRSKVRIGHDPIKFVFSTWLTLFDSVWSNNINTHLHIFFFFLLLRAAIMIEGETLSKIFETLEIFHFLRTTMTKTFETRKSLSTDWKIYSYIFHAKKQIYWNFWFVVYACTCVCVCVCVWSFSRLSICVPRGSVSPCASWEGAISIGRPPTASAGPAGVLHRYTLYRWGLIYKPTSLIYGSNDSFNYNTIFIQMSTAADASRRSHAAIC